MPDNITLPNGQQVRSSDLGGNIQEQWFRSSRPPWADAAATTHVAADIASKPLIAASAGSARKGLWIFNNSAATLAIAFGAAVTSGNKVIPIPPKVFWVMDAPIYQGAVHGVWDAIDGEAWITELT
jgi:hypothetical protein